MFLQSFEYFLSKVGSLLSVLSSVGACEGVALVPHWAGVPQTTHRTRDRGGDDGDDDGGGGGGGGDDDDGGDGG